MTYANEIAIFAARFNVTAIEATALPQLFAKAAKISNVGIGSMINLATYSNNELGEFIAKTARNVFTNNPELITTAKNSILSAAIMVRRKSGETVKDSFDNTLGAGAFDALVDSLRPAQ